MVVTSYILFWTAECTLGFSGILALVTLGLGLSSVTSTTIDRKVTRAISGFWKYAMYFSETLIFIAIGLFSGYAIKFNTDIHLIDALYILIFFVCTILARFIAIAIFYYPLSKLGYGLDWKKYVVLSYGGLRGSHSLILALVLDNTSYPELMRDKVVLYMGGVTILSLLL
jgi:CPA1 family monovalent cation:H+ antiporter